MTRPYLHAWAQPSFVGWDRDLHARISCSRYQSMVRRRPSSNFTLGDQPSSRLILEMSGLRRVGSSLGRGLNAMGRLLPVSFFTSLAACSMVNSPGLPV